jgi:hypothetical protein
MNTHDHKPTLKVSLGAALIAIAALFAFGAGTAGAGPLPQEGTPVPPPQFQPGYEPHGPFYHQIHLARSSDGLT